jgi:hypothetical protein
MHRSSALRPRRVDDDVAALDDRRAALLEAVLGERVRGLPSRGGTGGCFGHHLVDLLEGEALGFRDEEEGVDEGGGAEAAPDEEDGGAEVALVGADHVSSSC